MPFIAFCFFFGLLLTNCRNRFCIIGMPQLNCHLQSQHEVFRKKRESPQMKMQRIKLNSNKLHGKQRNLLTLLATSVANQQQQPQQHIHTRTQIFTKCGARCVYAISGSSALRCGQKSKPVAAVQRVD